MMDKEGRDAVSVHLRNPSRCRSGTTERPTASTGALRLVRNVGTAGSCITYELIAADAGGARRRSRRRSARSPAASWWRAVSADTDGLVLCGVDAPPCVGDTF